MTLLANRWTKLRPHGEQNRLWNSKARFCLVPAGRRSGKTELAKRKLTKSCLHTQRPNAWFAAGAPTRDQAKRIWWADLKLMAPKEYVTGISESELTISFATGARLSVVGMDKPERIEGPTLDGIVLDEYGNMKAKVWPENVRPALSTDGRLGWAWLIGVPEGRNHYYDLTTRVAEDPEWDMFTWPSSDILPATEIAAAKGELDELTFRQEYEASFLDFAGRAYYPFDRKIHLVECGYKPELPLVFAFDFNVEPGIAAVIQEQDGFTCVIGEVHIPRNSNTPAVCRRLVKDYSQHLGDVLIYGDATGGARGTAKVAGSDWDLIKAELRPVFGSRLKFRVPKANPRERSRVNAMNSRLKTADGKSHFKVWNAPNVVADYEGVTLLEGGSGEIDKKKSPKLTHLTDGIGYYMIRAHPTKTGVAAAHVTQLL